MKTLSYRLRIALKPRLIVIGLLGLAIGAIFITRMPVESAFQVDDPSQTIYAIAWSPLGDKLASSRDFIVQIFDATSGQILNTLPSFSELVISLKWNPSGTKLAIASGKSVQVWDIVTSQTILTFQEHQFPISSVAWSPDGNKIASASVEKTQIWNATSGQVLLTLTGHIQPITDVIWHPGGTELATSGLDSALIVWDAVNGQAVNVYIIQDSLDPTDDPSPAILAISWKTDASRIAVASSDSTIRILDAGSLQLVGILKGHTDSAVSVSWSPNGLFIASGSVDGTIRIWDANTHETIEVLQVNTTVSSLDWSPDGSQLAYGGDDGIVYIKPVPLATPSTPALPTLADILTGEHCSSACYLGIEPGMTSQTELEIILKARNLLFSQADTAEGHLIFYSITAGQSNSPFIPDDMPVYIDVTADTVDLITIFLQNVTASQIVSWFGAPDVVTGNPESAYHLIYAARGAIFEIEPDSDTVDLVFLTPPGRDALRISAYIDFDLSCGISSQPCTIPTATPSSTSAPTPIP